MEEIGFWGYKKEIRLVLTAFLLILLLPIIAIVILTRTRINLVSDKLVGQTKEENSITVLDPASGEVTKTVTAQMVWPTTGVVTLEFGVSDFPYQLLHTGIDIANVKGTDVTPFMEGVVIYAAETKTGYGKHIIIDHGNNIASLYGHLDKILVYKGQKVTTDQVIGKMGSTGWSTGPHLHFQISIYGIPVNPRSVFLKGSK